MGGGGHTAHPRTSLASGAPPSWVYILLKGEMYFHELLGINYRDHKLPPTGEAPRAETPLPCTPRRGYQLCLTSWLLLRLENGCGEAGEVRLQADGVLCSKMVSEFLASHPGQVFPSWTSIPPEKSTQSSDSLRPLLLVTQNLF